MSRVCARSTEMFPNFFDSVNTYVTYISLFITTGQLCSPIKLVDTAPCHFSEGMLEKVNRRLERNTEQIANR